MNIGAPATSREPLRRLPRSAPTLLSFDPSTASTIYGTGCGLREFKDAISPGRDREEEPA